MRTDGVQKAARMKAADCLSRSLDAIDTLRRNGKSVTFASVAQEAHVSRSYLYANQYLHKMIVDKRESAPAQSAAKDMNKIIDMQKIEIQRLHRELNRLQEIEDRAKRLEKEAAELKEQLKVAYTY